MSSRHGLLLAAQKSIKNCIPFLIAFRCRFGSLLAAFWRHFCSFFAPRSLFDTHLRQKHRFSRNHYKTNEKTPKIALRHPSKTTRNRPKPLPRGNFFALKCAPRIWTDLCSVGFQNASLLAAQIDTKISQKPSCTTSSPQDHSKTASDSS